MKSNKNEIKQDLLCSWIRRYNIVNMSVLPEWIYKFNAVLAKIPARFFEDVDKIVVLNL